MNKCKPCPDEGCPEMRLPESKPFHPQPAYEPKSAVPNIYDESMSVAPETMKLHEEKREVVELEEAPLIDPAPAVTANHQKAESEGVRVGGGNTSAFALVTATTLVAAVATAVATV